MVMALSGMASETTSRPIAFFPLSFCSLACLKFLITPLLVMLSCGLQKQHVSLSMFENLHFLPMF